MGKFGLGWQVLSAVILGIFVGFFFGEYCSVLEPIGTIFVMLLQMVVLPYIPTLLMHGLGSLSPDTAKKLFRRGWFFLGLLWCIVFGVIYTLSVLIPTPLPDPSSDLGIKTISMQANLLRYIIPQNPFYDLVHNVIPAIALFSVIMGVAIMHLKEKEPLLSSLEKANAALEKVFKWLALVSPIGIFAHIANAMGTVNLEDLQKFEIYVIAFIGASIFLSLWVLPTLVSCLTSIPYKELIQEYRIVCILAFATGIPSIAFPFINNCMRRLAERKHLELGTFRNTAQTIVPLSYSFAQIGNCFLLFFIFFMAFFFRHPLSPGESWIVPFLSIPISFGTPQISIAGMSFLIDNLGLPKNALNLFVETMAVTLNFQVLVSVAAMLSLTILVILRYYGLLEINWRRLSVQVSSMVVVLFAAVLVAKQFIHLEDNYANLYYSRKISDVISHPPKVTVLRERTPYPIDHISDPLARVLKTGVLRVGYDTLNIPFCYFNEEGEVVGYDIAYAYQLAKDLDVELQLVPFSIDNLIKDLVGGYYDLAMSAVLVDENRILPLDFSHSYMEQANALVVPASRVEEFRSLSHVQSDPNVRIGAAGGYQLVATNHFAQQKIIPIENYTPLVDGQVDALLWSELPAYVWCLTHPQFTSLSYHHELGMKYFAYPTKAGAFDLISFINHWMVLKEQSGFRERQLNYWIRGQEAPNKGPRWSIIRNVLHWVK
jgi:proton glutamate symport protein